MSTVCIMPPHNGVLWYLNEMEKSYDAFAEYLVASGRTFFRIKQDGPVTIFGENNLFLAEPVTPDQISQVSQDGIDDAICVLNSTYEYYLTNSANININPQNDTVMQTLEQQMLKYIFANDNIVFFDSNDNKENVNPNWVNDDIDEMMTEYEPEEMQELDPEQVATNVANLMNNLNISLEPKDFEEILEEPTLCQILLGQGEEDDQAWRNDGILPTPLGEYLVDADFSDNEYENHELYHPF